MRYTVNVQLFIYLFILVEKKQQQSFQIIQ